MSSWIRRPGGVEIRQTLACRENDNPLFIDCDNEFHARTEVILIRTDGSAHHHLVFTLDEWDAFLTGAKAGEFDPPSTNATDNEAIPGMSTAMDICGLEPSALLARIGFGQPCRLPRNHSSRCQHGRTRTTTATEA